MGASLAYARGQRGTVLELKPTDLNKNELAVLRFLTGDGEGRRAYRITEIMEALGWHKLSRLKGNSRVRNSLRRLVRAQWVEHAKIHGDGTYQAIMPYPRPVSLSKLRLAVVEDRITDFKRADCVEYNTCLEQAIFGKWDGFTCAECSCYSEPDPHQKMMDMVRLRALEMASEMMEREGGPCRVRGVKPGADAKRTIKPKPDETLVPLVWPEA